MTDAPPPTVSRHHVIVVGAGFAGLAAARELRLRGHEVVIVEARDRIGGRTWTDVRFGLPLELGGTWVHWLQPHVWAELSRYGLGVTRSPNFTAASWVVGDRRHEGTPDDLGAVLAVGNASLLSETRTVFEYPYEPLRHPRGRELDHYSVAARIDELDLDPETRDVLRAFWTLNFNAPIATAGLTQAMRWCAAASGDWALMWEACGTYKVEGGTQALANAMLRDAGADLRLSSPVRSIAQDGLGVRVHADDETFEGECAIVTVPLNVLGSLSFDPPLADGKRMAAAQGQASRGTKIWARLKGRHDDFVAMGREHWPLTFVQKEYDLDDSTVVVAFGPDADELDVSNAGAVAEAIRRLVPTAEVIDIAAHDWVGDEYARETWPMLRPGQLHGAHAALRSPEGRVVLAGSDYATGWGGFIDGAIESGLDAARWATALISS